MTVGELQRLLSEHDDDMEVVQTNESGDGYNRIQDLVLDDFKKWDTGVFELMAAIVV